MARLAPARTPFMLTGPGSSVQLARLIADRGAPSVIVVTDGVLVELGVVAPVLNALKEAGLAVTVFSDVQPDPSIDIVMAGMIVLGVNDEMTIMREEIFGPFLPIKPYRETEEVIGYVKGHDRPLAFYPFTNDKRLAQRYITEVLSGSVGVNEGIVQVGQHGLPFGGVGASGMGHYHGYEGFLTFSKLRPVFAKGASRRSRRRYSRPTESARSSP